jgi:antitoxin VapB
MRELAAAAGETVTTAVRRAAEGRLQRVRRRQAGRSLLIGSRRARLPELDVRTADEILGYDAHGNAPNTARIAGAIEAASQRPLCGKPVGSLYRDREYEGQRRAGAS